MWPQWATGYAINAGLAVVGGVLAVYAAALGTFVVLVALILTFLDASGITPTTRRLLGRRASQNVVSFGERDMEGALVLVAHYDSGPTRTWPLRHMFIAMVVLLFCSVARVGGMSGLALTIVQFLATVVLIVYIALMLDIALSPTSQGESDNASGVGVVLRLAERLTDLDHFGVHVVLTGAQKARAQGMRAFLQTHRKQFKPSDTVVLNIDGVGGGELRETKKEGPLLTVKSHPQLTGNLDSDPFVNREPSDGYAAASAGLPSVTFAGTTDRLEEDNLTEAEEACVRLIEEIDEELA